MTGNIILNSLEALYKELERINSPLLADLQPGITKNEIEQSLKKAGVNLKLSGDALNLYKWRNGITDEALDTKTIGETRLFTLGVFHNFAASLESYHYYALENKYWDPQMFPLFGSGGGDFYLIDCNKRSSSYNRIMYFSLADPVVCNGVVSKFDSLNALIQTVLECYQKKAYWYDDIGGELSLEVNYKLAVEITIKNNPASDYWKAVWASPGTRNRPPFEL